MDEFEVRIVRLETLRVAVFRGYGGSPEALAWQKTRRWLAQQEAGAEGRRFFGFNNPPPAEGQEAYGYEQWVTVGPEVEAAAGVEVKAFAGGLYAVARCRLVDITQAWERLLHWREANDHTGGEHQWLEECVSDPLAPFETFVLDLYLPLAG